MNKRLTAHSLSVKMLLGVLLSLLIALVFFCVSYYLGNLLLDHTVYSSSFAHTYSNRRFEQLQNYVTQEQISINHLYRLNPWFFHKKDTYVLIYQNHEKLYETPLKKRLFLDSDESGAYESGMDGALKPLDESALIRDEYTHEYSLGLFDGSTVKAYLFFDASDAFYIWMTAASGMLSFFVFSFCFIVSVASEGV